MTAEIKQSTMYQIYRKYQGDIKMLEEQISAYDRQLENWIKMSGPGLVHGVSYDTNPSIKQYTPELEVIGEIQRISSLLKIQRANLVIMTASFEKQKRIIRRTSNTLNDLELKVFVMGWMDGLTNEQIARELNYSLKRIKNVKTTIYSKMKGTIE